MKTNKRLWRSTIPRIGFHIPHSYQILFLVVGYSLAYSAFTSIKETREQNMRSGLIAIILFGMAESFLIP